MREKPNYARTRETRHARVYTRRGRRYYTNTRGPINRADKRDPACGGDAVAARVYSVGRLLLAPRFLFELLIALKI